MDIEVRDSLPPAHSAATRTGDTTGNGRDSCLQPGDLLCEVGAAHNDVADLTRVDEHCPVAPVDQPCAHSAEDPQVPGPHTIDPILLALGSSGSFCQPSHDEGHGMEVDHHEPSTNSGTPPENSSDPLSDTVMSGTGVSSAGSSKKDRNLKARRSRCRIDPTAKEYLLSFIRKKPYPSKDDLLELSRHLELPVKVIQVWFSNHRTRSLPQQMPLDKSDAQEALPSSETMDAEVSQNYGPPSSKDNGPQEEESMLKRFLHSPLEQDPGLIAIYQAHVQQPLPDFSSSFGPESHARTNSWGYHVDIYPQYPRRSSLTFNTDMLSRGHLEISSSPSSAGGSDASDNSVMSQGSMYSNASRGRRRGRKQFPGNRDSMLPSWSTMQTGRWPAKAPQTHSHDSNLPTLAGPLVTSSNMELLTYKISPTCGDVPQVYTCSFCAEKFKTVEAWKRHEQSVHAPANVYVCDFELKQDLSESLDNDCFFSLWVSASACHAKPLDSRTFNRQDHLVQHIQTVHFGGQKVPSSDAWVKSVVAASKRPVPIPAEHPCLQCGYCGEHLRDWTQRTAHIMAHYKQKAHFSQWWMGRRIKGSSPANLEDSKIMSAKRHGHTWSCATLEGPRKGFYLLKGRSRCVYCGEGFADGEDWSLRIHHLHRRHSYRECGQCVFSSLVQFQNHLIFSHAATFELRDAMAVNLNVLVLVTTRFRRHVHSCSGPELP